jgi:hypothetical protein
VIAAQWQIQELENNLALDLPRLPTALAAGA